MTAVGVADPTGSVTRQDVAFALEECQFVIDAKVTNLYSDYVLYLVDPSGAEVTSNDAGFIGGETLRYQSAEPLAPGNWILRFRGFASGPDEAHITINFG